MQGADTKAALSIACLFFSLEAILQKLENEGKQSPCYCTQRSCPPGFTPEFLFGQVPKVMQSGREGANVHWGLFLVIAVRQRSAPPLPPSIPSQKGL